ncbi:MAG: helix-turn-helix transcriptional regulator [Lachnospiraceae bacterium]|nr:helix-turn-helix transcriptional regulator [Lachnospiraceae bacterium]
MNMTMYPTINMKATGARIKELRKAKGISVIEISEFMGFSEPQAVYKWQRGESLPTVDNLFALSRILCTSMEDILVGDDEMSSRFFRGRHATTCTCFAV